MEVESVRLRWIGHRLRAEAGLVVDNHLSDMDGHEVAVEAKHQLLHQIPKLADATVHISPNDQPGRDPHTTGAELGRSRNGATLQARPL